MTQIKTKHHHLLDPKLDVTVLAPPDGLAPRAELFDFDRAAFHAFISRHADAPRFIVESKLVELVHKEEAHESLLDLDKCGAFRLPFPVVWVELPEWQSSGRQSVHTIVLLWERSTGLMPVELPREFKDRDPELRFGAYVMHINRDADGEYLSMPPFHTMLMFNERDGEPFVGAVTQPTPFFGCRNSNLVNENTEKTYTKATGGAWTAAFVAILLLGTRGVASVPETFAKLNRRRKVERKPAIPSYRYIHINRVYRTATGDASDAYDVRLSPEPHWRRGHARRVAFGRGRKERRWEWFEPVIVAFDPAKPIPKLPNYKVLK